MCQRDALRNSKQYFSQHEAFDDSILHSSRLFGDANDESATTIYNEFISLSDHLQEQDEQYSNKRCQRQNEQLAGIEISNEDQDAILQRLSRSRSASSSPRSNSSRSPRTSSPRGSRSTRSASGSPRSERAGSEVYVNLAQQTSNDVSEQLSLYESKIRLLESELAAASEDKTTHLADMHVTIDKIAEMDSRLEALVAENKSLRSDIGVSWAPLDVLSVGGNDGASSPLASLQLLTASLSERNEL